MEYLKDIIFFITSPPPIVVKRILDFGSIGEGLHGTR